MPEDDNHLEARDTLTDEQIDQVYRSIGSFIVHFSHMEQMIRWLAAELLKLTDDQFYGLMPVIDFRSACNICEAQLRSKPFEKAEFAETKTLLGKAHKLAEDRNRVAHAFWFVTGSETVAWHASKNKLDLRPYFEKQNEIDDLTREARVLVSAVQGLLKRFSDPAPKGVPEVIISRDTEGV
jgi:hypothetical protein